MWQKKKLKNNNKPKWGKLCQDEHMKNGSGRERLEGVRKRKAHAPAIQQRKTAKPSFPALHVAVRACTRNACPRNAGAGAVSMASKGWAPPGTASWAFPRLTSPSILRKAFPLLITVSISDRVSVVQFFAVGYKNLSTSLEA